MQEIRKDIPNFSGYQVSNLGEVRNIGKKVKSTRGAERVTKKRIMTKGLSKNVPYYRVYLMGENKRAALLVHRLVYCTFNNIPIKGDPTRMVVINHIDHDKLNNRLDNLEMISQYQNVYKGINLAKDTHKLLKRLEENHPEILKEYNNTPTVSI